MKIDTSQSARMEQGLALLPKMLQSIEVLQLTSVELLSLIERELEQNETLVAEAPAAPDVSDAPAPADAAMDRYLSYLEGRPQSTGDEDPSYAMLQNLPGDKESLQDYVAAQLGFIDIAPEVRAGVTALSEFLDERGLLTASDDELLELLDRESLVECLDVLQSLEPRGIGARDPISAMLLQLSPGDPDFADIASMLQVHLEALARNKVPEVARALGRTAEEVQDLLARIRRLDPRPGAQFVVSQGAETIEPDVRVRLNGEDIEVEVGDASLPDLGLRADYEAMVAERQTEADVKRYLREKLAAAKDLIHAVEQRKRTLGRVTLAIMHHQRPFLLEGPLAVRSLTMNEIAEELDIHPSTVSRTIAGKTVQTDHGIYRLRDFFDGDRRSESSGGQEKGRMAIKDHIRDLIAGEDPAEPLSDDELVRLLAGREIKVARRTVAKYRTELGLPSSWRRRKYEAGK